MNLKICIIGKGNVGSHLYKAFKPYYHTVNVSARGVADWPADFDLYILAVKDDMIGTIADSVPSSDAIVVHTAGSVTIDELKKFPKRGVIYPLQTFSKDSDLDYSKIPFFIEGTTEKVIDTLNLLVSSIGVTAFIASSSQRLALHIAAVFSCNFTNYLWDIAEKILKQNKMPFSVLEPLLKETLRKSFILSPNKSQTGPAVREDYKTMNLHKDFLSSNPQYKIIYDCLSESIIKNKISDECY